ncbi:MAG TPA: hypothetical protein VHM70_16145 [Polyangiaceae bacterium]|nr:hypothetical protein [Polyangiaceae bacterium]
MGTRSGDSRIVDSNMGTRVRFIEEAGNLTVLEIESPPHHPLSYELPRTLGELGLVIVGRETRMRAHRSLQRVEVTELDGSAVSQERRLHVQSALVRSAGETPIPLDPPPDMSDLAEQLLPFLR